MSRSPVIEQLAAPDRLAHWHRWLGFSCTLLICGHVVLTTAGYALGDGSSLAAETWTLLTTYPWVLMAAGGTLCLLMVAEPEAGRAWRVGIRHPEIADRVAGVVDVRDLAVATSGAYERGDHILDPRSGRPARDLLSLTVIGPSLTLADAYSTAAFAMGRGGASWIAGIPGYEAHAVTADRRAVWTEGCRRLRVQDTGA